MRNSTHYNLNLVEGTDLVNPLVQDVPNYELIDEQMYKNQNAGICTATEIKSGTVHAINRLVPDCPMFRFTATSDYNDGDTFTVDGVQVSAKLPNGENLSDRCYVTNAEVIGVLVGALITFFIPDVGVAKDSERLGGELPAYYAKKTEVDQAQLLAESAADLSQNNQNSINKLNDNVTWKSITIPTPTLTEDDTSYIRTYNVDLRSYKEISISTFINEWGGADTRTIFLGNSEHFHTFYINANVNDFHKWVGFVKIASNKQSIMVVTSKVSSNSHQNYLTINLLCGKLK